MLWQEKPDNDNDIVADDIQDLSFRFECAELPLDHAGLLKKAVVDALPWMEHEPGAAIHTIHGAASGNGWSRPEVDSRDLLQLSRRTRLYVRVPKNCVENAKQLQGMTLDLGQFQINIGAAQNKMLSPSATVFARSVCSGCIDDEDAFISEVAGSLAQQGIQVTKMLCGLSHTIQTEAGMLAARSILISDLTIDESVLLQATGIGEHQLLGCGIFLPHKSLAAVGSSQETL